MMRVQKVANHTAIAVSALAALTMLMIGASPASAGSPVDGMGTVGACTSTGKIGFKPAIILNPMPDMAGSVKIKSKGTCAATGMMDGAHVTAAKSKGTGTTVSIDCLKLQGMQPSSITVTIKWKTDGTVKLNPSTVTISSTTGSTTMDGHASFDATGSVTMGSFSGGTLSAHIETDQTAADILTACAAKGTKKLTFGLNMKSTLAIN